MDIVKTMQVKVVSIGPGKLRPTNEAIAAARQSVAIPGKPAAPPVIPESKDCIQAVLAVVDSSGRYMNRTTLSFVEGKMVADNKEVGPTPDALNAALSTVFSEIDKVVSALNAAGKIAL
jgi:hypothetical protein